MILLVQGQIEMAQLNFYLPWAAGWPLLLNDWIMKKMAAIL